MIGLIDLDMINHIKGWTPNPTLMQVSAYYKQQNEVCQLVKNLKRLDAYRHLYVFKNNLQETQKDRYLSLDRNKTTYIGYYYSNKEKKKDIFKLPCDFSIYEISAPEKILRKCKYLKQMKRNSIVNFKDNDFSNFYKERNKIFISDFDFFDATADKILQQYISQYTIVFLYPQYINSYEQLKMFFKYYQYCYFIHNSVLNFNEAYSYDFINKYQTYNFLFHYHINSYTDIANFIQIGNRIKMSHTSVKIKPIISDNLSQYNSSLMKYSNWLLHKDLRCFYRDKNIYTLGDLYKPYELKYLNHRYN